MLMIEKQPAFFFKNYLCDMGIDADFVDRLIAKSFSPDVIHKMQNCKWDKDTMTVTTPEDEHEAQMRAIEDAA